MVDTAPTLETSGAIAGTTVITDSVIAKIVGITAREVSGVHTLANGAGPLGAIRDAISGADLDQGVSITVADSQVAVDISLVAEYPVPLHKVAADVRAAVIAAVESLVELQVTEVNVTVKDVHLASDDDTTGSANTQVGA
ncbi:Asp23/Gls24 family envelope stress response protein [Cryobacterium sp. Sr8]|uniref:Asp23/Gls24 family envelope stress response protein n=1 Tax=Cryobacterium sp. Sr8 TaxID=1259203 RepID=UPI00106A022A|nr:Asp23/Gls24 family envelope stress response protein [Cryobacterium sp. Sr8]TFD82599.1 Asp23/Gls24 family envelope stress response protein [Cryobacterium sp. Sr8]